MLNSATDAHGNVEVRGHDFASLAYLHVVGHVSRINGGTRGTHSTVGAPEGISEVVQQLEVLTIFEASSAADHKLSTTKVSHVRLADYVLLPGALDTFCDHVSVLNRVTIPGVALLDLLEVCGPHRQKLDRIARGDRSDSVACIDWPFELLTTISNFDDVSDGLHVEEATKSRDYILAEAAGGGDDLVVPTALHQLLGHPAHEVTVGVL